MTDCPPRGVGSSSTTFTLASRGFSGLGAGRAASPTFLDGEEAWLPPPEPHPCAAAASATRQASAKRPRGLGRGGAARLSDAFINRKGDTPLSSRRGRRRFGRKVKSVR